VRKKVRDPASFRRFERGEFDVGIVFVADAEMGHHQAQLRLLKSARDFEDLSTKIKVP